MRILLLLLLFLLNPVAIHAQIDAGSFNDTQSSIVLQPSHPAPQESYTATLNDYSGNFSGAQVRWYSNNTLIENATNVRTITLEARTAGSKDTIKAVLTASNGETQTLTATVQPIYADIIIEPQTHVPDFYAGRALASVGSTVNLTALINGSASNASQYIYTWRINDAILEGGPLRGRNEISFTMPQDSYSVISLQVTDLSGVIIAKRAINIPSVFPKLLFYEVSTLYGIEPRSLTESFALIGNSATLRAEPYFLSSQVFNAPDILSWNVAGSEIGTPSTNPYEVTLQKTGFPGTTQVGLHVRSTDILLQGAEKRINVSI